nr:hypothetical protein [uncultured Flavobacterium sp.]
MYFIRVLSCIAFCYLFINLSVYAVIPLPVSESYMLIFCFAIFLTTLVYVIASDSITYKKQPHFRNLISTAIVSAGIIATIVMVTIRKNELNQPTLLKAIHSGDLNERYTIDFKTSGIYIIESNYFSKDSSIGNYNLNGNEITMNDSSSGIASGFRIIESKTEKHLLPLNKTEDISEWDYFQIIEDNRKK